MKYKLLTSSLLGTLAAATLCLTPAWANLDDNLRHTPAGADAFVAVSTDQKDWDYFLKRKPFSTMHESLLKEILPAFGKEMGIDAEKDLLPLFGSHISAAVYGKSVSKKDFPALIAVDLSNPAQFQPVLDKLKAAISKDKEKERTLLESSYKGIQVYGVAEKGETQSEIYMALSGNTLLFGNQTLIQEAIDTAQSSQTIVQDAAFASTLKSLRSEKVWFYMNPRNLDTYLSMVPDMSDAESKAAIKEIKKSFALYNSFGLGLDLNSRGLRFKSFTTFHKDGADSPEKKYLREIENAIVNPKAPLSTILRAAPERPLFFAAAQGFHLIPSGLKLFLGDQPEARAILDEVVFKGFKSLTHLDMDKDILAHSDGRVGMSLFYPENLKTVTQPPHAVIYLGVKNNEQFLKTLNQKLLLDFAALESEEGAKKKKKQANTITFPKAPQARYRGAPLYMSNLTPTAEGLKKEMGIQAGYTYVNNLWFFGSNMEALKAAIDYAHSANASLLDNNYFTALREKYTLKEDAGMFFVDLGKIVGLVKLFMGEDEEVKSLLPTLSAFKSVVAGGSYKEGGAEGLFLIDVDMEQIDFELLAKMLGESEEAKEEVLDPPTEAPAPPAQP
ncbi:MAG: DUF3352 domain-containing protein [Candidatus Sericytochromatia bacterium]|nr:DUF3352 domain-containing protein [Candidatus Sericytochromatia bacterium]